MCELGMCVWLFGFLMTDTNNQYKTYIINIYIYPVHYILYIKKERENKIEIKLTAHDIHVHKKILPNFLILFLIWVPV